MEENRFFRWLWRINAIGLFLLLCAGLFSFLSEQLRRFQNTERTTSPISTLAEDPKGVEKWVLGSIEKIRDSSYILLPLISEYNKVKERDKVMYYTSINNRPYYGNMVAKNILFINKENSQSSWLFNSNNQLILEHQILYILGNEYYSIKETNEAKLVYYTILDRDTNGDKIVNTED